MGALATAMLVGRAVVGQGWRHSRSWLRLAALVGVVAYGLSLSGGGVASADSNITISAAAPFAFSMKSLSVDVGSSVTWTTTGQAPHSITSDGCVDPAAGDCTFDSGATAFLRGGTDKTTFTYKFTKPGVYQYLCRVHGGPGGTGQVGTIVVGGGGPAPATASQLRPNVSAVVYSPTESQVIAGDKVNVQLGINGAAIRAPVNGQVDKAYGHFNLILDQTNINYGQQIGAGPGVIRANDRTATLENVSPGAHTLVAVWTYDNNVSFDPPISWTVHFTTTAGAAVVPPAIAAGGAAVAPALGTLPAITPPSTGDAGLASSSTAPWAFVTLTVLLALTGVRVLRRADERA